MSTSFKRITCSLFFMMPCLLIGQSWKLAVDKDDIKVYTRDVPSSKFKEFKGETVVKSSLSSLVELIDDVSNYTNWLHNCKEAKRLKTVSRTVGYNYSVVTAPWPVSDRDVIVKYIISQDLDSKEIRIDMNGVKDYISEVKGIVRVPSIKGLWLYTPMENGLVKVTYQVHSETGGYVPASVANAFVEETPYNTLKNLKEQLKKPKYRNAVVVGVLEP